MFSNSCNTFIALKFIGGNTDIRGQFSGELICLGLILLKSFYLSNLIQGKFKSTFVRKGYTPQIATLSDFSVFGVAAKPSSVTINGQAASNINYDDSLKVNILLNFNMFLRHHAYTMKGELDS